METNPALSLIDTRAMLAILRQMLPVRTALGDRHFQATENHPTKHIDIDIIKGTRNMAISVNPRREGNVVNRLPYTTKSYEPPYFREKRPLSGEDLLVREPGQPVYGAGDIGGRMARLLGQDMDELDTRLVRAEEFQRSELIQTGACSVFENDGNTVVLKDTIDFGMSESHLITLSGGAEWSDTTDSDPIADLQAWIRQVMTDSGLRVKTIYFGAIARQLFMNHPKVLQFYQGPGLRINLGTLEPKTNDDGTILWTTFMGADILEYPEWVIHPVTQETVPLIADYACVLVGEGIRASKNYGLIRDPAVGIAAAVPRFPKVYVDNDPPIRWIMLQSAFLNALHQVDGVLSTTVGST